MHVKKKNNVRTHHLSCQRFYFVVETLAIVTPRRGRTRMITHTTAQRRRFGTLFTVS
jgi:hypothetical protein